MKFYVSDIEFDFNTDMPDYYSVNEDDQELITRDNLGAVSYTHLTLPTICSV